MSQADKMATAISTASTAFVALTETQRAIPSTVEVYADKDWQDTDVIVRVNDKVEVKYISGTWSIHPPWGYVKPEGHALSPYPTYPIPDAQPGELIGKIGQSLFRIGRQVEFASQSEGRLYLRMNDDFLTDNDGVLRVQITVSDAEIMGTTISTVSTGLAETQPALPSPSPSRAPSNTPRPPTATKTASPVPSSTEETTLSSTAAPETLTPGALTCQLNINQNIQVLDGTNLWSEPDVVNGSLIATLPAGTSVYVISAPTWGRIQETGVSGWWWEISNESNGASTGWIWEGRIAECN
jgi:hypothetical protein